MTQGTAAKAATGRDPGPGVAGIRSVVVYVDDLEQAVGFYVGVLGFAARDEDEPQPGFRTVEVAPAGAATGITLVRPSLAAMGADGASLAHDRIGEPTGIVLEVDDLEAARVELERRGVELVAGSAGPPWKGESLTIRDPSDNELALVEARGETKGA